MGLRLTAFLESNSLISMSQYGFRQGHSTIHPMLQFHNTITTAFNNKEHAIAIFCDMRKAFDTINFAILFKKMYKLGIRGLELEWFKDYLKGRHQFVCVNGFNSKLLQIIAGVPQGSVLGPLLFLLYINDLPESTSLKSFLFADDTTLLAAGRDRVALCSYINEELHKVATYLRASKLALHPGKTNV